MPTLTWLLLVCAVAATAAWGAGTLALLLASMIHRFPLLVFGVRMTRVAMPASFLFIGLQLASFPVLGGAVPWWVVLLGLPPIAFGVAFFRFTMRQKVVNPWS